MNERLAEKRKVIFVAIGIAYGIVEAVFHSLRAEQLIGEIFRVFVVLVLLYFLEAALTAKERNPRDTAWRNEFIRRNEKKLCSSILRRFEKQIAAGPKAVDDKLVMEPAWLAKRSYEIFWEMLVERNAHIKHPSTVLIVHSSEIEVWSQHPELLRLQGRFCRNGGKIVRVLCGREQSPSPPVLQIVKEMVEEGITVYYYDVTRRRRLDSDYDFSWDFALVTDTSDVCVWDTVKSNAPSTNDKIQRAEYFSGLNYRNQDLKKLFDQILADSTKLGENGRVF